jgi:outer membrane protein
MLFTVALLASGTLVAQPAPRELSLEEALRIARERQPQLRQQQAATAAARARADQALAPLLPQVSATAAYQRQTANFALRPGSVPPQLVSSIKAGNSFDTFNYFNFGLSASQLLWDFGQTTGRLKAARAVADAQRLTENTGLRQVEWGVRSAYFEARAAKALVRVAHEALDNQERHAGQIEAYVQVGARPEIDLAQVRTDRANARVQLINAENAHATALARLNQAMGLDGPPDYEVADEAFPHVAGEEQSADALMEEALRARPEVAALAGQVSAAEVSLAAIEGGYWPSLNLSTGLTEAGSQLDNLAWNWSLGLGLNWSLYQGGATRAQAREARAQVEGLKAQQEALRQQVRLDLEQARLAVRAAEASVTASGEASFNARERLRLAEGRYATGVGNAIELSDAQLALTNAQAQQVQAEYSLAAARAQLLKALGRP